MDETGADDVANDSGPIELSLNATPVAGEPLTVRLIAKLTGGPDNNIDLHIREGRRLRGHLHIRPPRPDNDNGGGPVAS